MVFTAWEEVSGEECGSTGRGRRHAVRFLESESMEFKPHASYLLLGFQKKQRSSGCGSLKVVEFHMARSTTCSKYSQILRLVLTKSFLYIITCVLQMLSNDRFSCHPDLFPATLKWDLGYMVDGVIRWIEFKPIIWHNKT